MSIISDIQSYLGGMLSHYWVLISGFLLAVEPTIKFVWSGYDQWADFWLSPAKRKNMARMFAILAFLAANYLTFQDEHDLRTQAEKDKIVAMKAANEATPTGQQERTSELERELGEAKRDLGESKKELADLAEKSKPRRLTAEQKLKLEEEANRYCPTLGKFVIMANAIDIEAITYADDFMEIFSGAGCDVSRDNMMGSLRPDLTGFHIGVTELGLGSSNVQNFSDVISKAGFSIDRGIYPVTDITPKGADPNKTFVFIIGGKSAP